MEASILICSKGRRYLLKRLISTIKRMEYSGQLLEIIVVEETNKPKPLRGVTYIAIPVKNFGIGYARNIALSNATKPIVVFVDDDCEVEKKWLIKLLLPFSDPEVMGVAGAVKVRDCNAIGWAENIIGVPGGGLRYVAIANGRYIPTDYLSTVNCAYRKEILLSQGGFDVRASLGGEDALLARKICRTGKCIYVYDAVVYHKPRANLGRILKWFIQRGRAEIKVWLLDERRSKAGFYICRSSITLKLFVFSIIGAVSGYLSSFFGLFFIVYLLLNISHTRWAINLGAPFLSCILVPAVKIVMDIGTDIGRGMELICNLRRRIKKRNCYHGHS